ncbi:glycoside hydrolase family 15 protein, partial [Candidatus Neomarinimicrobiota bacterium]
MDFGVIGNCKSAALVDSQGNIIWCCLPDFDSPSVFAQLLDAKKGGAFSVHVDNTYSISQRYLTNTNILATRYESPHGGFEILDFMPRYKQEGQYHTPPEVVRYIRHIYGAPEVRFQYNPRLGYAQHETSHNIETEYLKSSVTKGLYDSVYFYSNLSYENLLSGNRITIDSDSYALLSYHQKILGVDLNRIILEFEKTKVYWLDWIDRTATFTRFHSEIKRSALVLKLLSYQETGAILAAVTTSLPETIGEQRNWDYRFCWIRDASMTLNILTQLGHFNVAERFFDYILDAKKGGAFSVHVDNTY